MKPQAVLEPHAAIDPRTAARENEPSAAALDRALTALETVILGKPQQVRLCLACLLARGHLLIEDVPGVGKTTLAHALAHILGLAWQRVQFTSDLLPADIIGVSVFDRAAQQFHFRNGPIFTQLLLADEVNRASPRTQSALLEAMEERQVSVDLATYRLPEPFFVVATQNPHEELGTFALPESQLDRFLMRITLGYPDARSERELLRKGERRDLLAEMPAALDAPTVVRIQQAVRSVHVSDALLDYVQALIDRTRGRTDLKLGLSPRAGQGLIRAAQAWAHLAARAAVLPEDVQAVLPSIAAHRLERRESVAGTDGAGLAEELVRRVPVPM
ncbi:MAG TPA: AAA family ATPase [Steroidobacteraceae bacterium]|nr:AAA family ATPase [Steroidobacteraceae bacterium]